MNKELKIDEARLWQELKDLSDFGKRPPGSINHQNSHNYLLQKISPFVDEAWKQTFQVKFHGKTIDCANICALKKSEHSRKTILIGSHFDTRWMADNETDPQRQQKPIPGVNDGGSGVAVIMELARVLQGYKLNCDLLFVFFDAEDLGNIDGLNFSIGAEEYATNGKLQPNLAIILDMVGGLNMHLNIEHHSLILKESHECFRELFQLGRENNFPAFFKSQQRMVISDHYPFLLHQVPAIVLMDIDYPQWHTHSDDIDHCCSFSLYQIAEVLFQYLTGSN